jgi:hypothetical protein
MDVEILLEDKINYQMYGEDNDARHPIEKNLMDTGETLNQFKQLVEEMHQELNRKYPGYKDFKWKYQCKQHGHGTFSSWYQLYGIKEETRNVTEYFQEMEKANGTAMAYTLTAEYFGMTEDEIVYIIEEGK